MYKRIYSSKPVSEEEYAPSVEAFLYRSIGSSLTKNIGQEGAEKLLKESTEKLLKESAEKTVKESAEKLAKEGGEKVGKETAQAAGKKTSSEVAQASAKKKAKKQIGEVAGKADDVAQAGVKKADDVAQAGAKKADDVGQAGAKKADDAGKKAGKKGDDAAKKADEAKAKDSWLKKNKGKVVGGVAAGALAAAAYARYESRDGGTSNITKISSEDGYVSVEFGTTLEFCSQDKAILSGTNSTPSVDGSWSIKSVVSSTKIIIDKEADIFFTDGTAGQIELDTSFESQISCTTGDVAGGVVGTVGNVAGGIFKEVLDKTGLGGLFKKYAWVFYVIIGIVLLGAVYKLYVMFGPKGAETAGPPQGYPPFVYPQAFAPIQNAIHSVLKKW